MRSPRERYCTQRSRLGPTVRASCRLGVPKICRPLRNSWPQAPTTDHHPREVTCRVHQSQSILPHLPSHLEPNTTRSSGGASPSRLQRCRAERECSQQQADNNQIQPSRKQGLTSPHASPSGHCRATVWCHGQRAASRTASLGTADAVRGAEASRPVLSARSWRGESRWRSC